MYKPGSAPITVLFYDDLVSILEYLTILNSDILLKGDFNLHVERTSDPRSIRKSCQRSYTYPRRNLMQAGDRLTLAVYYLFSNQFGRVDIFNRQQAGFSRNLLFIFKVTLNQNVGVR
ncbi:hypothetical protein HELRODRAFT_165444 [Helobdella robusta]|uniref:Endonuclease/exonuclease/phosphatase domain-containing protein n=1 Tax=Helobdella robusta TaxID=6412 RepID=T1EWT1_HELRO|nr:hypothetical protein HELRODRAFT_165444 [Helobdella robusta]ESN91411.1 hypothetical protein HELRODRAFT_165444 [Helobdella robusta]